MVYLWKVIRVWDECFCNDAMNGADDRFPVCTERYHLIRRGVGAHDVLSDIYWCWDSFNNAVDCFWQRFYSSEITNFVASLESLDGFPDFLHLALFYVVALKN